jgi:hypothetical protein
LVGVVALLAERAVSLAPELADGHIALANLRLHDRREAEAVHEARLARSLAQPAELEAASSMASSRQGSWG